MHRIGVVLLLTALVACSKSAPQAQATPTPVATAQAHEATLAPAETLAGIIAPFQNVSITTSLTEPTLRVDVNEGDMVHRGQELALLNTDDLQADFRADVAQARNYGAQATQYTFSGNETITQGSQTVKSAQAALRQAKLTLANDSLNLGRYVALFKPGYIPEETVTTQRTLVNNDQQTVSSDEASLTSALAAQQANGNMQHGVPASMVQGSQASEQEALAQADQYRAQIERGTIVSPVDGIVINRYLNPGEYPGTRVIFTVQQLNPVYAVFNASDAQLVGLRQGAKVALTTVSQPDHVYHAKVVAVLGQENPGSTNFVVRALLQNPGYALKSGMAISAHVKLAPVRGISIPVSAFLDDSHSSVMVVRSDGTVQTTRVRQIGAQTETAAIVAGLPAGTTVIANGQLGLTDGQRVALR